MRQKGEWSFAAIIGLVALASLSFGVLLFATTSSTTVVVDAGRCAGGGFSTSMDGSDPPGTVRVNLTVRGGEPFLVPLPEEATEGARYEVRGLDTGIARADAQGNPIPSGPRGWAGVMMACSSWPAGKQPEGLGPFVAERDGNVTALLWPLG